MNTDNDNNDSRSRRDALPELTVEELRLVAGGPIKPIAPLDLLSAILGGLTG